MDNTNDDHKITPNQINLLMRDRRSIFPASYTDQPISDELINIILENANWAPTHKFTEPWRFKIFKGAAKKSLGDFLADWYQANVTGDKYSEKKYEKTKKKINQSACVIAICMHRDAEERVPEWEEVAAVACAVQNMWLTCSANDIGCYWSSPKSINDCGDFLGLKDNEQCLGFFYMGYHNMPKIAGKRQSIKDKVKWM